MFKIIKKNQITAWIIAIVTVTFWVMAIPMYSMYSDRIDELWIGKENRVLTAVESGVSVLSFFKKLEDEGKLDHETAQERAKMALRGIRYGGGDYLWINDLNAWTLMHPIIQKLDNADMSEVKDKKGKLLFKEFVRVAQENKDGGFVDYYWPKPGKEEPVRKKSFVKLFEPWGWVVGSGIYVDDVEEMVMKEKIEHGLLFLAAFAIINVLCFIALRNILVPLKSITSSMTEVAGGSLETAIPFTQRFDAIGDMGRAVEIFRKNALRVKTLEENQIQAAKENEIEKRDAANKLADEFQSTVGLVISRVLTSIHGLESAAQSVSRSSEETKQVTELVARESLDASMNVQTVASATEELSASIHEISAQVAKATTVTVTAVDESKAAHISMDELVEEVEKINNVTTFIAKIAHETNLLALNATIEAARAGEAGKGFNVVAHEVKNLATQTTKATADISNQLSHVQSTTSNAAAVINSIGRTINVINGISSGVAAAVEEQNAATNEIARSVDQTSRITQHVSEHIAQVHEQAVSTGKSANAMLRAAEELGKEASDLRHEIDVFLSKVRPKTESV